VFNCKVVSLINLGHFHVVDNKAYGE